MFTNLLMVVAAGLVAPRWRLAFSRGSGCRANEVDAAV